MLDEYVVKDNENTVCAILDGKGEILNLEDWNIYGLNSVATFIWEQADGQTKVEQIIEKICREFEVDWDTAEDDCLEFLNTLISKHLVILSQNPVQG